MRFSLRTFIIVCIVTGIIAGLAVREYRLSIPGSFPVTYSTTRILDVEVPEKVLVWRNRSTRRETIAAEKAYDLKLLEFFPTDEYILEKLLNNPSDISYTGERERSVINANREQFLQKAPEWLSNRSDHATLIGAAHVLAVLNDRRGFDLAIKRLPQISKDPQVSMLVHRLACASPNDWPTTSPALMAAARDVFDKAPNQQLALILEKSGDKNAALHYYNIEAKNPQAIYFRTPALKWLTQNAPSEEVFQLVKQNFSDPKILIDYDAIKLLELYLESENPRWRSEACDLAMKLATTPPSKQGRYQDFYHHLICAHGGVEYLDYFKDHVAKENCSFAARALGRLLPRQEYLSILREKKFFTLYLEEEGDAAIPFLREENAIFLIANHQAGSKDPVTAAAIRMQLSNNEDFYTGIALIDALETLGVDMDRDKLMDGLKPPQYDRSHTSTHWLVNRISNDDFLKFANQYAADYHSAAKLPTNAQQVFDKLDIHLDDRGANRTSACQLMAATGIAKEFVIDDWGFESVGVVARDITGLIVDDLPFESVSFESPHLRFAAEDYVFEVDLIETHSWYDPVAITDVLNSILDNHSESPRRLYCFQMDYDWNYLTIAYLDAPFVKELGEMYAIYPLNTKRVRQKQPANKK